MIRDSSENTNASQSLEIIKKQTAAQNFHQSSLQVDQLLEELFCKRPTFLLSPFTEVTAFTCGHRAANLNDFERFKMAEVESAFALVGGDENRLPMTSPSVIDVYDSFWFLHVAVKVAIRFCRQLEAFNRLKEVDQLSLLKSFLFSILMIRFAWSFDFEKDGWPVLKVLCFVIDFYDLPTFTVLFVFRTSLPLRPFLCPLVYLTPALLKSTL